MTTIEYLKNLVPFSQEELDDIIPFFQKELLAKNEVLVEQGQVCRYLYFIEKGIGRSYYLNSEGKEITQWFFSDGKFMTSLESFFQERPSLYYLEVLEETQVYTISREDLDLLFRRYHKVERLVRLLTTEMLTKVVNKLNAVQFQQARERYDYMLTEFPDIISRVPLGHIASYLGMSQETLSRIRRKV